MPRQRREEACRVWPTKPHHSKAGALPSVARGFLYEEFPRPNSGDGKNAFAATQASLVSLKATIDGAKRMNEKHTPATIRKVEILLEQP